MAPAPGLPELDLLASLPPRSRIRFIRVLVHEDEVEEAREATSPDAAAWFHETSVVPRRMLLHGEQKKGKPPADA